MPIEWWMCVRGKFIMFNIVIVLRILMWTSIFLLTHDYSIFLKGEKYPGETKKNSVETSDICLCVSSFAFTSKDNPKSSLLLPELFFHSSEDYCAQWVLYFYW